MRSALIVMPEPEFDLRAIRAAGAGGRNVNRVSCAIHPRFDIGASSLPAEVKAPGGKAAPCA